VGLRWFFKEPEKPYGVRTPLLRELAAGVRAGEAVGRANRVLQSREYGSEEQRMAVWFILSRMEILD